MRGAGARPVAARSLTAFEGILPEIDRAIIDLTARAYDGIAAIATASAAGLPVLAIGQHDDRPMREGAWAAGAGRVLAYRRMFEDGPRQIAEWLTVGKPVETT